MSGRKYLPDLQGYWFALGNPKDRHHQRAIEVSETLDEDPITTWPLIFKTCCLLQKTLGVLAVRKFLDGLQRADIDIFDLTNLLLPEL